MRRPIPCGGFPQSMACGRNDYATYHTKDQELHGYDRCRRFTALFSLLYFCTPFFVLQRAPDPLKQAPINQPNFHAGDRRAKLNLGKESQTLGGLGTLYFSLMMEILEDTKKQLKLE